jgi:magnesium chelatase subunit D
MMQRALLLNAVNPRIGGLVLRGEKGTAKSVAVRALAALLPDIETSKGCRFACDPNRPEDFCAECAVGLAAGENPVTLHRPVRGLTNPAVRIDSSFRWRV